jgi:hypothetical protein
MWPGLLFLERYRLQFFRLRTPPTRAGREVAAVCRSQEKYFSTCRFFVDSLTEVLRNAIFRLDRQVLKAFWHFDDVCLHFHFAFAPQHPAIE